ncbi:Sugar transferase involved in LPS biosynthesis (colanic, teichoic acid) [Cyclonatronum proteinivorum]|uniref:Sugar transferase involved in LPS biosynthesis (Colanic, teichoic acid) n=2 Tax=Cyclonatronum proteinivorum TaxID=1457365 RepID=A0A345UMG2_9BACT|nr:Sugar transferase involved in LPS biosynthesis (colanic, teichoic acid) [Cyclonatronum proteinivorum]
MKRFIDSLASLLLILFLTPVYVIVVVLLTVVNHGSPFFTQQRPGLFGRSFKVIKFKTMNDRTDPSGKLLPDSQRLTTVGKLVRSLSIDELPQLFNVLKGDMSLVGPRPLLVRYLDRYTEEQARRHEVKPGITGWAQVNGRNAISWEEKFKLDVWYVDNLSFWLDMKILFMTLLKVFRREGISNQQAATMPEFMGTKSHP